MSPGSKTLKMYALTGIVKSVKARSRKITLQAHIHGKKEPVQRDYMLKDEAEVPQVRKGDFIHATLFTDNAEVWLLDEPTIVHNHAAERLKTLASRKIRTFTVAQLFAEQLRQFAPPRRILRTARAAT